MILLAALLFAAPSIPVREHGTLAAHAEFRFDELAATPFHTHPRVIPPRRRRPVRGASALPAEGATSVPEAGSFTPMPIGDFLSLPDNDSADPPDTNGAAGPNHLMTTLNTQVRIQDKAGAILSTMSIEQFVSPVTSAFISDPHITYDPFNDRFVFTMIAFPNVGAGQVILGASATGDPTGVWHLFKFDDTDPNLFIDYPLLGFNKDFVVVETDEFSNTSLTSHVWTFNKTVLYAGSAQLPTIFTGIADAEIAPAVTYDNTLATEYLLSDWDGAARQLHIYALTSSSGTPILSTAGIVQGGAPWDDFSAAGAPQKGNALKLDPGDSRLMDVIWKNGSLWTSHTVFLPPGGGAQHGAGQWWKITPPADILAAPIDADQVGLVDDPLGLKWHCYTSIAVNDAGDVLLGGTAFALSIFPSAFIAFHGAADPASSTRASYIYKAGEHFVNKGGGDNRWGDFSATVPDPDGSTFWTLQEYGAQATTAPLWGTWWAHVDPSQNLNGPPGHHKKGCSCDVADAPVAAGVIAPLAIALLALATRRRRN